MPPPGPWRWPSGLVLLGLWMQHPEPCPHRHMAVLSQVSSLHRSTVYVPLLGSGLKRASGSWRGDPGCWQPMRPPGESRRIATRLGESWHIPSLLLRSRGSGVIWGLHWHPLPPEPAHPGCLQGACPSGPYPIPTSFMSRSQVESRLSTAA